MFTLSFTDPQGIQHVDAIFEVANAEAHHKSNDDYTFNFSQGDSAENQTVNSNTNKSVRYRMYYWANQAARDSGLMPYVLVNTEVGNIGEWFRVDTLDATYDGLTAQQKAEKHCQEVTLA